MTRLRFWRSIVKLAWRDLYGSRHSSIFIAICIAVSISGISGVRGAANIAREALHRDSRAWLAGDVSVDTSEPIGGDQAALLNEMRANGIAWTLLTTTLTMARSEESADPGFISVKAIDPSVYPFYGTLALAPLTHLGDDAVAVSQDVLDRLHVRLGEVISIAGEPFRISSLIEGEPDRFTGALGVGMRCILSRAAYERSGLARSGNSSKNRVLLRLPADANLERARQRLQELFPEGSVMDYREANRHEIPRAETAIAFLGVTAFLALAIGAIGVAIAVRYYVDQRMPTIAVMKMVGGGNLQLAGVLLFEIGCLIVVAFFLGVPLGFLANKSVLALAGRYIVLPSATAFDFGAVAAGAAAALIAITPVLVEPTLVIWRVRPALILRRDSEQATPERRYSAWIAAAVAGAECVAIGSHLLLSSKVAVLLIAGLVASAAIALVLAAISVYILRRILRLQLWPPLLRCGLAGLHRPGSRSQALIVAVAMSLVMVIATFEGSEAVVGAVVNVLPYDRNTLLIAGFEDLHAGAVRFFLGLQPGVESIQIITQTRLRLTRVDGAVLAGSSFLAACDDDPGVTIGTDVARFLGIRIGSRLQFDSYDRSTWATVVAIRNLSPGERFWSELKLNCTNLSPSALFHQAAVRVRPDRAAQIRAAISRTYPALAVITTGDISATIQALSNDAATLARIIGWYAVGAGLAVLIAIVASSRARRLSEIGILSALGAPSKVILKIYTIEFAALGALSGMVGSLVASGFISVILSAVFERTEIALEGKTIVAAVIISTVSVVAAAWLPAYALLKRKPLEVLRAE